MIVDLDTCEWRNPGANPSMVTIEQAVARGVPVADRAELLRQFHARERFDFVRIHRDRVYSESGKAQYAAVVSGMNFGNGGLCHTVTRKSWSDTDYQGAMVFQVNGHFYGYAAVCRNLFTLLGRNAPMPPALPPAAVVPAPLLEPGPRATPFAMLPPFVVVPGGSPLDQIPDEPSVFFSGPPVVFGGPVPVYPFTPPFTPAVTLPPVAEPEVWVTMFAGLAALAVLLRGRTRRW